MCIGNTCGIYYGIYYGIEILNLHCVLRRQFLLNGVLNAGDIMEISVTGTFAPKNFRFSSWNFRSLELSFPGTIAPWLSNN